MPSVASSTLRIGLHSVPCGFSAYVPIAHVDIAQERPKLGLGVLANHRSVKKEPQFSRELIRISVKASVAVI
jgi:hypothetical protein